MILLPRYWSDGGAIRPMDILQKCTSSNGIDINVARSDAVRDQFVNFILCDVVCCEFRRSLGATYGVDLSCWTSLGATQCQERATGPKMKEKAEKNVRSAPII